MIRIHVNGRKGVGLRDLDHPMKGDVMDAFIGLEPLSYTRLQAAALVPATIQNCAKGPRLAPSAVHGGVRAG
jgi:hypothetical protein